MPTPHDSTGTAQPLILTVPGLNNSGPEHWQSLWEEARGDVRRVELGMWDRPHRHTWVNQLNLAIHNAGRPVVLVAHSLGCLAVAWWATYERPTGTGPVIGALLVAPPQVDVFPLDEQLGQFAPTPAEPLPFRSILVASRNDPYMGIRTARQLARAWGSSFADAGEAGHINADSALGDWQFGKFLLNRLLQPHSDGASNVTTRQRNGASDVGSSGEVPRLAHGAGASSVGRAPAGRA